MRIVYFIERHPVTRLRNIILYFSQGIEILSTINLPKMLLLEWNAEYTVCFKSIGSKSKLHNKATVNWKCFSSSARINL